MVMLLEILCTLMVTSHFMKNIHKWKSNLVVTAIVTLLPYLIFKKLIEKVNKHEDKFEIELEYKNPYQTLNGWKKVDYTKTKRLT